MADMQTITFSNRRLNSYVILLTSVAVLCIFVAGLLFSALTNNIQFETVNAIDAASLLLFLACCALGFLGQKTYYFLLPFILIAFPTAVNNFMPGVFLGKESPQTTFPLLTHIDIFLALGVFKSCISSRSFQVRSSSLITTVVILFTLSSLVNIIFADDSFTVALIIAGLFPVRYLLLIILLVSNADVTKYEKKIIYGLMVSVFFLLLESLAYTRMNPDPDGILVSGSLAANTFGNIIAAIMIFFIFIRKKNFRLSPLLFYPLLVSCVSIILLTETRMSILAALTSFLLIQFARHQLVKSVLIVLTFGILVFIIYTNIDVPKRYSIEQISSKIEFKGWSADPMKVVEIERTQETSSIISRLKLYSTALEMLYKNPLFGTGYGTFNYLKTQYGFDEDILIDAHNGYLNTLAQLGLSSVFLLYFIYWYPFKHFRKGTDMIFLKWLFVINTTMAIADLSNAGIYKYSVFALLAFNSIILSDLKNRRDEAFSVT